MIYYTLLAYISMHLVRESCAAVPLRPDQHFPHQQQGTDDNGAIGDVERRPVVLAEIEVEEVGDGAFPHTVPQVTERPAHNQRESDGVGVERAAALP